MTYQLSILTFMAISVIAALSLNLIAGYCGQVSLGHAAFIGMGAYTAAILVKGGTAIAVALPAAMISAGLLGVVVGLASLRVRHDFLAVTTMGVNFLFVGIVRQQSALGGELGISAIPDHEFGKLGFAVFCIACAVCVGLVSAYVRRSWAGSAFDAISEDEDTARMLGIDVANYKLIAFALGTAFAGLAGALYALNVRFIAPESFGLIESITVLCMVVVGGIGSIWGVALAAALLSVLPLWFQFLDDYKLLCYGCLLFLMMRFRPDGFAGIIKSWTSRMRLRSLLRT